MIRAAFDYGVTMFDVYDHGGFAFVFLSVPNSPGAGEEQKKYNRKRRDL